MNLAPPKPPTRLDGSSLKGVTTEMYKINENLKNHRRKKNLKNHRDMSYELKSVNKNGLVNVMKPSSYHF